MIMLAWKKIGYRVGERNMGWAKGGRRKLKFEGGFWPVLMWSREGVGVREEGRPCKEENSIDKAVETARGGGWCSHRGEFLPESSVQSLSRVGLFATPWTTARQASVSITNSWSLLKLMSIESVMPSNHLILCRPLLLLPSIFPSIRVFSSESGLRIRWPKFWSFSFSISPSNEYQNTRP